MDDFGGQGQLKSHSVQAAACSISTSIETLLYLRATHPWICNYTRCLYLHDLLNEFDAAYTDSNWSSVPSLQYVGFDRSHLIPYGHIMRVCNARDNKRKKMLS